MNLFRICSFTSLVMLGACASTQSNTNYMDPDGYTINVVGNARHRNPDILRVIEQDQFRSVIVINREVNAAPNQEGITLAPETVESLLLQIKVRKQQAPELLFEAEEAKILSQGLAKALSSSNKNEDIAFYYPQERGMGLLKEHYMTTGRAFIQEGKLNIIFGNIQQSYEGQWVHANVLRQFQPGSRQSSSLVDWTILNHKQATVSPNRKDWVQISLVTEPTNKKTIKAESSTTSSQPSAEIRLQKLQELKAKGLIDENEFQLKRQEILNTL